MVAVSRFSNRGKPRLEVPTIGRPIIGLFTIDFLTNVLGSKGNFSCGQQVLEGSYYPCYDPGLRIFFIFTICTRRFGIFPTFLAIGSMKKTFSF
jgi:hypothetical protein